MSFVDAHEAKNVVLKNCCVCEGWRRLRYSSPWQSSSALCEAPREEGFPKGSCESLIIRESIWAGSINNNRSLWPHADDLTLSVSLSLHSIVLLGATGRINCTHWETGRRGCQAFEAARSFKQCFSNDPHRQPPPKQHNNQRKEEENSPI